jgi:adenylate cyclase
MVASNPQLQRGRGWTILLVDDEPDILESLQELLQQGMASTTVVTRTSGRAGLAYLDAHPVDLVISDFKMPGMDGIAFLTECRRRYPWMPRVMLTAYPSADLESQARDQASVDAFLSKAGDPMQIMAAIKQLSADLQRGLGYEVPR